MAHRARGREGQSHLRAAAWSQRGRALETFGCANWPSREDFQSPKKPRSQWYHFRDYIHHPSGLVRTKKTATHALTRFPHSSKSE